MKLVPPEVWMTGHLSRSASSLTFAPEREVLQKAIDAAQANVSGRVRLKLFKGNASVVGRRSESSLYDPDVATFEADQVYQQSDAEGFIRLNALRLRLRQLSRAK